MSGKVKVLVVGQTPPPWHGQAVMIQSLVEGRYERVRLYHVRMAFSDSIDDVGRFRFGKIAHLFGVIARIIYYRVVHGVKSLCYPPAGPNPAPLYRDIAILLCTRWMFRRTVLHFHAGGISELYPELPAIVRWLVRRSLFGADVGIRISRGSPADATALQCKREFIVPYGIEDNSGRVNFRRSAVQHAAASPGEFTVVGQTSCDSSSVATIERSSTATCESTGLRILFVGIVRESKGVLVLIEACGLLAARGVPLALNIVGQFQSPEFEAAVRQRIDELSIADRVHMPGPLTGDDKWQAYAEADVFCFPTFYESETFGIVLVEAMSFGLPVVATRWRGIPEIVDDERTGFLVDPHDASSVADRLEELHDDPTRRRQLGEAGRTKFLQEFTVDRYWHRMEEAFLETAGA